MADREQTIAAGCRRAADDRGRVVCLKMRYNSSVRRDLIFKTSRSDRSANYGLRAERCVASSRRGGQVTGAQRISTKNLVPAKNIFEAHCLNLQVCNIRKQGANLGLSLLNLHRANL
ncbi:hypothetical protein THAOC_21598 [Thalassiosira oceanica]|uniref:Uncharacterized protein n=1 Tax=Thalassiosira oceanica TaxID=159749 RepID=K0RX01_THAOC|nr:hypothetical protein THAOC_21598 [Thalassiosira oceanica]|eukprot:EJK58293.1 hypothetical protein THAOC_21598 [Thalassiosira oceanica]